MELFKSLENKTKSYNDPFKHFEINQPLTDSAIKEVGDAEVLDPKKENSNYLGLEGEKKQLVAFVIGGPNKYYAYTEKVIHQTFNKVKTLFTPDKYKIIVIPSYRTPKEVIKKAYDTFNFNHHVVKEVDKKAYLSALAISDHIIVTCDSTSMISEAAVTGKPVYILMMKSIKNNYRFKKFYNKLQELGITRELKDNIDTWSYENLNEAGRIASLVKSKMKSNGII